MARHPAAGQRPLHQLPAGDRDDRAEDLVAGHDVVERLPQRGQVEPPAQPDRHNEVHGGTIGSQLRENPDPLLAV